MSINTKQIKILNMLLNRLGIMEMKADLIAQTSKGRVEHTKDMTFMEAKELIDHLNRLNNDKANNLRRAVISKFITMGAVTDTGKSDIAFIDEALKKRWHKGLNDFTVAELRKLLAVIETKLLPWYFKKKETDPNFSIKG